MDREAEPASQRPEGAVRVRTLVSRLWPQESLFTLGCLSRPTCEWGELALAASQGPCETLL